MVEPCRCAIVIPCLNEEVTIDEVVTDARREITRVVVVDDGSTDRTAERAAAAGAIVIRHEVSRGKGAAIRTGIERSREMGAEWVLLMDGDGQHAPDDIRSLLARGHDVDLVVGNRMGQSKRMPWIRRIVNVWMTRDISRWSGIRIPDSQCGFRLVRIAAWDRARPAGDGFELESEMLVAFGLAGLRIAHVPVQVRSRERGRSRIRVWRDTVRWFRWRRDARSRVRRGKVDE